MKAITKKDLINYLKKSPENLNFNIFGTMLDDFRNTYETDEQIVNKIKNIITNIIEDGGSISPEDDTITELIDLITEELTDKITNFKTTIEDLIRHSVHGNFTIPAPTAGRGVVYIGTHAFFGCTGLTSVEFEEVPKGNNNAIGSYAFSGCSNLTSLNLIGFKEIYYRAFENSGITKIYFSTELEEFVNGGSGQKVFDGMSALTDIYYTGTQEQWESISGLSDAGIPVGVTIHYEYDPTQE